MVNVHKVVQPSPLILKYFKYTKFPMTSTVLSLSIRNLCRMLINHDGDLVGCLTSDVCLLACFFFMSSNNLLFNTQTHPPSPITIQWVSRSGCNFPPMKVFNFLTHYNLTTVSPPPLLPVPPCLSLLSRDPLILNFPSDKSLPPSDSNRTWYSKV